MNEELLSTVFDALVNREIKEMPDIYTCSCKSGLTYDKTAERCQRCYGAGKVREKTIEAAIKNGDIDFALKLFMTMLK